MRRQFTVSEVRVALEANLRTRPELGLWKAVVDLVLEPRNPFDSRARRRPKKEFVLLCLLIISDASVFLHFNKW
jgi:hypothetical protein